MVGQHMSTHTHTPTHISVFHSPPPKTAPTATPSKPHNTHPAQKIELYKLIAPPTAPNATQTKNATAPSVC